MAVVGAEVATKRSHPTREVLIDTVVVLLETKGPEDLKVEEVLRLSGISTGSLYHHFKDFSDLIDQAIIARYLADIDVSIELLTGIIQRATDAATLAAGFLATTGRATRADRAEQRLIRAQVMVRAATNDRFRAALFPHQQRLTTALADLFRELQDRGLFDPGLDPIAGSVFIQAYSLGLVVNDVSGFVADEQVMAALVSQVVERSFFAEGTS